MFLSREDAGRQLGNYLKTQGVQADVVLGLPRGGVVVAAEVAQILRLPLDVLVVRKIGHPWFREFALGALAEKNVIVLDEPMLREKPLLRWELDSVLEEEQQRLQTYLTRFHPTQAASLEDKVVLLVDDGLATGATTQAAVRSARKQAARRIIVAAPVASSHAVERLTGEADEVRALLVDPKFDAVGRYYQSFSQTTDEEVLELLRAA